MPVTVNYGANSAQKLDYYRPVQTGKRPAVLCVPGGGWTSANRAVYATRCTELAAMGYVGVAMSYRVLPSFPYPAQVQDITSAYNWMKAQTFIDKNRIAVIGMSAGAYGVSFLGVGGQGVAPANIKCMVLESGIYNLAAPGVPEDPTVAAFLNGADPASSSPFTYASATSKPAMLVHGAQDTTIAPQQSIDMKDKLASFGVPASLTLYTGGHGNPTDPVEAAAIWAAEKAFIASYI